MLSMLLVEESYDQKKQINNKSHSLHSSVDESHTALSSSSVREHPEAYKSYSKTRSVHLTVFDKLKAWCKVHNKIMKSVFLTLLTLCSLSAMAAETADEQNEHSAITAGWLENVIIEPWKIKLRAKLDTGAKTSSLHALDIHHFKQDGVPWVRFHTEAKKDNDRIENIELPVKREVKIKSHHNGFSIRPVVELEFCLNGQHYKSEFSLVDRSNFNYSVLLGRRVLKQGILVDASSTFLLSTTNKRCKQIVKTVDE